MKYHKIHIIGGPGSGKSFASNMLSKKLSILFYDLDDIFWEHSANDYHSKTPDKVRSELLGEIIKKDQWILEGVYYRWLDGSFQRADAIIILKTPLFIRNWRLIVRFIKRKLGIISSKKESISDCISLIKWNNNFDSDNLVRINSHIQKYGTKINEIRTKRQLKRFIENISKGE